MEPPSLPRTRRPRRRRRNHSPLEASEAAATIATMTTTATTLRRRFAIRRWAAAAAVALLATSTAVALVLFSSAPREGGYDGGSRRRLSLFVAGFAVTPAAFQRRGSGGGGGAPSSCDALNHRADPMSRRGGAFMFASVMEKSEILGNRSGVVSLAADEAPLNGAAAAAATTATALASSTENANVKVKVNGDGGASFEGSTGVNGADNAAARSKIGTGASLRDGSETTRSGGGDDDIPDVPQPTAAGGFCHTRASRAKISAANKGKVPWNKGKERSEEVKRRIAEGVRRRNRERFIAKLADMGLTEEEYEEQKKEERRKKDAERRARRTEKGGYRPTEETRAKISAVLKEKWAKGEVKKRKTQGGARQRGFRHTEETRQKIRDSLRKRWATDPEYRAKKVSSARRQNSSEGARMRIAATLRKKWEDPEFRAYMMERMSKRKKATVAVDDEHRRKISMAMKRKWQDADYRAKATEGMRRHLEDNPRPKRSQAGSSSGRSRKSTRRMEVGEGIYAVSPAAPKRNRTTRMVAAADGTSAAPGATVKRKKRKKKAAGEGAPKAADLRTEPKSRVPKEEEPIDMSEGSLDRLRLERRDLYDLLYGDEGEAHFATEAAIYCKDKFGPEQMRAALASAPSVAPALSWHENDLDDENLDNFDPYGLDDF